MLLIGGGVSGKGLCCMGGTLILELVPLKKKTPESSFILSAMWGHNEKTDVYSSGSGFSSDTEITVPSSWTSQPPGQ